MDIILLTFAKEVLKVLSNQASHMIRYALISKLTLQARVKENNPKDGKLGRIHKQHGIIPEKHGLFKTKPVLDRKAEV